MKIFMRGTCLYIDDASSMITFLLQKEYYAKTANYCQVGTHHY
jgi:hypothetical protein